MPFSTNLFHRSLVSRVCATIGAALLIPAMATAQTTSMPRKENTQKKVKPLFRDFMGLNVHSLGFKPALYKPVCRLLRDYHPFVWDTGDDTSTAPPYPMSENKIVNWQTEYGSWKKAGYQIDASLQFEEIAQDKWKDMAHDTYAYGLAFARFFGPSGPQALVSSAEIGNEPSYSAAKYRTVFENMARGLREGDPKLNIVTCSTVPGANDQYSVSISAIQGLESLYDVINIHTYAFVTGYPTWLRSFPEDPKITYLTPITQMIAWRDSHAPGKQIWVTEFGWDATTKPDLPTGDFSKWVGSTETQQAQYLVRSFLVFSAMAVDRAYIYYFDDDDTPHLHGSSGLTRNSVPKPSFYAVSHLYHTLGDYRFDRIVKQEPGKLSVYEYQRGANKKERIWAVWSPTGSGRQTQAVLPIPPGAVLYRAEQMPLKSGTAAPALRKITKDGKIQVGVSESPIYLWIRVR